MSGVPLGNGCTLPAVRLRFSGHGQEAAESGAVNSKSGWTGRCAVAVLAGGQVGTCPLFPVAPPSSTSGSTLRSSSSLPTPTQKPTSNKEDVYRAPCAASAWGCTASSWLARPAWCPHWCRELGDDPAPEGQAPARRRRDSTGATRARLRWMPGVSRADLASPEKRPHGCAWAGGRCGLHLCALGSLGVSSVLA